MTRIPDDLHSGKIHDLNIIRLQIHSNCWLCEGWTPHEFEFGSGLNIDEFAMVKIHIEIEDFKGDLMERVDDSLYKITRMLPPGTHRYFFTVKNELRISDEAKKESTQVKLVLPKIKKQLLDLIRLPEHKKPEEPKAEVKLTAA